MSHNLIRPHRLQAGGCHRPGITKVIKCGVASGDYHVLENGLVLLYLSYGLLSISFFFSLFSPVGITVTFTRWIHMMVFPSLSLFFPYSLVVWLWRICYHLLTSGTRETIPARELSRYARGGGYRRSTLQQKLWIMKQQPPHAHLFGTSNHPSPPKIEFFWKKYYRQSENKTSFEWSPASSPRLSEIPFEWSASFPNPPSQTTRALNLRALVKLHSNGAHRFVIYVHQISCQIRWLVVESQLLWTVNIQGTLHPHSPMTITCVTVHKRLVPGNVGVARDHDHGSWLPDGIIYHCKE